METKYTKGECLNHIGSCPNGRTWQQSIYNSNGERVFIAIGSTKEEAELNANRITAGLLIYLRLYKI